MVPTPEELAMVNVCGAAVVVTFDATPDVRLAAVWDGGPWCSIHVVQNGTYTVAIERWKMADDCTGEPCIPCTPSALAELVETRTTRGGISGALLELAADFADSSEHRAPGHHHAPDFSTN
jgi:hypothetical protein